MEHFESKISHGKLQRFFCIEIYFSRIPFSREALAKFHDGIFNGILFIEIGPESSEVWICRVLDITDFRRMQRRWIRHEILQAPLVENIFRCEKQLRNLPCKTLHWKCSFGPGISVLHPLIG